VQRKMLVKPMMMMIEKKKFSFDNKIEKDTLFENMIYEWMNGCTVQ